MRKSVCLLFCIMMLFISACSEKPSDEVNDNEYAGNEIADEEEIMDNEIVLTSENTKWLGRVYNTVDPNITNFSWTASGFELRFKGTGIEAYMGSYSYGATIGVYVEVLIDGEEHGEKIKLGSKRKWHTLASGLNDGEHTVRVVKNTEALVGIATVEKIRLEDGGELLPPDTDDSLLMEFIGDSITCGHTLLREEGSPDVFSLETEDGNRTYAAVAANSLDADFNCISVSGWTVYKRLDTDNGDNCSLADMYEMTDPANGITAKWDFNGYLPDIVVVNLGTNDGTAIAEEPEVFYQKYYEFIKKLRRHYPDAKIICTMGMTTDTPCEYIERAVADVNAEGDDDVFYFKQSFCDNSHPVERMHISAGNELAEFIKSIM